MILRRLYVCYRRTYRNKKKQEKMKKIRVAAIMQKGSYRRMRGTKLLKLKATNKKRKRFPCSALFENIWQKRSPFIFFCLSYLSLGRFVSDSAALVRSIET